MLAAAWRECRFKHRRQILQHCRGFDSINLTRSPSITLCGIIKLYRQITIHPDFFNAHAGTWGWFHERFSHRYSNSINFQFWSHLSCSEVIVMKFCTCHGSCAKFVAILYGMIPYNGVTLKQIFQRIWITVGKSFVKWAPDQLDILAFEWHTLSFYCAVIAVDVCLCNQLAPLICPSLSKHHQHNLTKQQ